MTPDIVEASYKLFWWCAFVYIRCRDVSNDIKAAFIVLCYQDIYMFLTLEMCLLKIIYRNIFYECHPLSDIDL